MRRSPCRSPSTATAAVRKAPLPSSSRPTNSPAVAASTTLAYSIVRPGHSCSLACGRCVECTDGRVGVRAGDRGHARETWGQRARQSRGTVQPAVMRGAWRARPGRPDLHDGAERAAVLLSGFERGLGLEERGIEPGGDALALLRGEVGVAARHGQPARLARRRDSAQRDVELEVLDQPRHHGALLRVLLAEEGGVWRDDVEELRDDRRDAAKEAWAGEACQGRPEGRRRPRRATKREYGSNTGHDGEAVT